jgi:hypothetical protein
MEESKGQARLSLSSKDCETGPFVRESCTLGVMAPQIPVTMT